jgi:hypothetical protein
MGIEITVIDDSDKVGWLASATRIGEIYMTSVTTMVDNVKKKIGNNKISRLNILDHGNKSGIQIGNDWVSNTSLPNYQGKLRELQPYFEANGIVHLQHCNVGQNRTLLLSLARIFGVSVYAGTGKHNPIYRFNFGEYVRADPDGTFASDAGRP